VLTFNTEKGRPKARLVVDTVHSTINPILPPLIDFFSYLSAFYRKGRIVYKTIAYG
jgi:hypothetical protein